MQHWRLIIMGFVVLYSACNTWPEQGEPVKLQQNGIPEMGSFQTADTAGINKLFVEARPLMDAHTDSAINLYLSALSESKLIDYFLGVAYAYKNLALCYKNKNDFSKGDTCYAIGMAYLKKVIPTSEKLHQPKMTWHLCTLLIDFAHQLHAYDEVIHSYQIAQKFYNDHDSIQQTQLLQMKIRLGEAYFSLGQYDSAYSIYASVLPEIRTPDTNNYVLLSYSYLGLGCIQGKLGLVKEAVPNLLQAVNIARKFDDTAIQLKALQIIANFYQDQQDYKNAKKYAYKVLAIANKTEKAIIKMPSLFSSTFTITSALIMEGKLQEALIYSNMAQSYARQTQNKLDEISANTLKSSIYMRINQPDSALKLLDAALRAAVNLKRAEAIIIVSGQLGGAYAAAGNYKSAYELTLKHAKMRDSLRGGENAQRIAEINAKYQVAEKDKALAQQQLQIERQQKKQYLWIGGTALLVLLLLGLLWRKQHRATLEKLQARLAGEEQERSRMARELHDGIVSRLSVIKTNFSALPQNYRGDGEAEELQEAIRQLDQSIAELRNTSHNLMPEMLKRNGLIATIHSYCGKISQTGSLQVVFQMIGTLPALKDEFQLNIYRIIQELLQNILKHSGASRALIQFNIRDGLLEVTVDDNGHEVRPEKHLPQQGMGLHSINDRVKLLEGTMETEQDNGTSIYLTFDLKRHTKRP